MYRALDGHLIVVTIIGKTLVGTVKRWSRPLNRGFISNYFLPLCGHFDYWTLERGWLINRWLLNGGSTVVTLAECHTRTAAQRLSFGSTKRKKLADDFTAMLRKLAESFTQKYTQTTQKWHKKKDVWRERGQAIKALDLQFGGPKFKSSHNCWPDLFTGSGVQIFHHACKYIANWFASDQLGFGNYVMFI